jgi:urease accessory protein UreF
MNVLGLVQLTQFSAAGAEGYYLGAQKMLGRHEVHGQEELILFVHGALETAVGPSDAIASGIAFRVARGGDLGEIPAICDVLAKESLPQEMRLASLQIGRRLWETSRQWQWAGAVHEQLDSLVPPAQLHHAVAFGALVSEATNSQIRAIATYLFHVARGIVLAAVRLIPLDEHIAPRVLSAVQPRIAQLAAACADKGLSDITPRNPDAS